MITYPKSKKQRKAILLPAKALLLPALFFMMQSSLFAQPQAAGEPSVLISSPMHNFMNAVWSPDGQTIAFSTDNFNGIWLADADGSNLRQLTDDGAVGFGFSWSPDGSFILGRPAVYENRRRYHQVKIYDVNTKQQEVLLDNTRDLYGLPAWSPDGSQVAMVLDGKIEFRTSEKLEKNSSETSGSVIYAINGKLFNINQVTRSDVEITAFEGRTIFNVSISPNRSKVAFQVQGKGLYVLNTDGSQLKHLGQGEHASWLPGSDYIVVTMVEDDGHYITGGELYAVNVITGEYHHLTGHTQAVALKPAVSPCGHWVAFENPNDGNIYVMELR
jgi:Tol biopolymer transport system component